MTGALMSRPFGPVTPDGGSKAATLATLPQESSRVPVSGALTWKRGVRPDNWLASIGGAGRAFVGSPSIWRYLDMPAPCRGCFCGAGRQAQACAHRRRFGAVAHVELVQN